MFASHRLPIARLTLVLLGLAACSSDDSGGLPGADTGRDSAVDGAIPGVFSAFEGFWRLSSMSLVDGEATFTATRDSEPVSLRGDVTLVSTGTESAELRLRMILLEDGLPGEELGLQVFFITDDAGTWLIDVGDGDVVAFEPDLQGNGLTLDRNADHPGDNASSDGPNQVVVERANPPAGITIGTWNMVSVAVPGGTLMPDTCFEEEVDYSLFSLQLTIDDDYLVAVDSVGRSYADAECTEFLAESTDHQFGAAEEVGDVLDLWLVNEDEAEYVGEYIQFDLDVSGDEITLTRSDCLPVPDCESDVPSEVVVERAE